MDESPSVLHGLHDVQPTVRDINDGSRKRMKRGNRLQTDKENRYRDPDPLALNLECPCNHNSARLQCKRIAPGCLVKNRKRFFKQINKVQQDIFLTRLIAPYIPERRRQSKNEIRKKRTFSTTLYLYDGQKKRRPVCQALFLKVFSIKRARLHTIADTVFKGQIPKEKRGGDRKSSQSSQKKEMLKEFLNKLPASESHYSRNKTKRIYLLCDLNQAKLRRMYNNSVQANLQVKKSMFQKIFTHEFNIGFKSPASDTCSTCILLQNKIKAERDPVQKGILITEKRVHSLRAKAFYNLSRRHIDDPESICFCFDLQQVQPLPKTPIQKAFYARQISFYNLCFVAMDSRNPIFYQWTEVQSGRGSTEVGSALLNHLDSLNLEYKKVLRLFCDGCGGQNKNSHIIHALMFWLVNKSPQNIEEIWITYPVRGLSFLPADRVFGRVEKHIRTKPIIIKREEYEEIYKEHGTVKRLGQAWELFDIKSLDSFYKKLENMRDLKRIQLKKYNIEQGKGQRRQTKIFFQVRCFHNYINENEEERQKFCILKRKKDHPRFILYQPLGRQLTSKKKIDVRCLLTKQFGEDWEQDTDLLWYKNLLKDEDDNDYEEEVEIEDCNDEQCDCL